VSARAPFEHRGTRAVERMVEHAPSSGGLALWVRHVDLPDPAGAAPPLATDGTALHYGAAFEALPIERQAGRVANAVLHVAFRHVQRMIALRRRTGDVDATLFAACADAIVNTTLGHVPWLRLPEDAVTLERLLVATLAVHDTPERLLADWDVERLYRTLDDREPARDGRPREDGPRAARTRALGGDTPVRLLSAGAEAEPPEGEAELARDWAERIVRAHAGDGAMSMLRALGADLPRSRVPWEQQLRVRLARGLATRPELSWSRPSRSWLANRGRDRAGRRMPFEPGTVSSRRVPRLAVIVDVSGSIDDALLERFSRELDAITRRAEAGVVLVVGDDAVRRVAYLPPGDAGLRGLSFQGRGGTDFAPLLREADAYAPDIGVVLTDLDGPADFRPRWPVLWAVPAEAAGRARAPFGRVVAID
jgi:predicted metal-dependent peptidase